METEVRARKRSSASKRKKRHGVNEDMISRNVVSPRQSSVPRLKSPRDKTQVIVNGKLFDDSVIQPIKIPNSRPTSPRPVSPREAVPGYNRRSPSRLSPRSTLLSPESPNIFIPCETPAISDPSYIPKFDSPSSKDSISVGEQPKTEENLQTQTQGSSNTNKESEELKNEENPKDSNIPEAKVTEEEEIKAGIDEPKKDNNTSEGKVEEEEEIKADVDEPKKDNSTFDGKVEEEKEVKVEVDHSKKEKQKDNNAPRKVKEEEKVIGESNKEELKDNNTFKEEDKDVGESRSSKKEGDKGVGTKSKNRKKKKRVKGPKPIIPPVLNVDPMPDYNALSDLEKAQSRELFRVKFGILRDGFRNFHIPDCVGDDEPLEVIHARYDMYLRHIHISTSADDYRKYLYFLFLIIEVIATRWLGLPCGGYTIAQIKSMSKYEKLLIELGEKYYVPGGSEWPIEYRIIFLALFNAVVFIGIQYLANIIGSRDAAETIVNLLFGGVMNNNSSEEEEENPPSTPKGGQTQPGGGVDLGNIIGVVANLLNNNNQNGNTQTQRSAPRQRRRRGPVYRE
jgi:hypothetical protein